MLKCDYVSLPCFYVTQERETLEFISEAFQLNDLSMTHRPKDRVLRTGEWVTVHVLHGYNSTSMWWKKIEAFSLSYNMFNSSITGSKGTTWRSIHKKQMLHDCFNGTSYINTGHRNIRMHQRQTSG